jgi:hypothetical protein
MQCENCGRDFNPNRGWQRFCDKECQQAWNRFQYKKAYRKAELMLAVDALKGNGRLNANGNAVDDEHRAKWAAIRAEWVEEDRQEAQQPRLWRRF